MTINNFLEGLTPKQLGRLRSDWLRCVSQITNDPDPQPSNFLVLLKQVSKVANRLRIILLLRRCYHLIIPVVTADGTPVPLDEVTSNFESTLSKLHEQVPLPTELCPRCGAGRTRLFRQFGLGGGPDAEWAMVEDLGYAEFKHSCISFGPSNRICDACGATWLERSTDDEERILAYARARIAYGNPWNQYLKDIQAEGVNDPSGLSALARKLPSGKVFSEIYLTALEAHDLLVPLFSDEHYPRPLVEVKRDILQAERLLHEKYPQPPDKCPDCGGPGIVRFTGYPMPALNAAERLGYAGSSGCIGSSTSDSRMCRACGERWKSLVPYELAIFEYLDRRFATRRVEPASPNESSIDFSDMEPIGKCPQCGDNVYELDTRYVCCRFVGDDSSCEFRSGKMILQQVISTDDMRQLLTEGRTRFLNGFVSNRTKRRFTASLAISPEGKVGFEFDEKTKALIAKAKQKTNEASGRRS